MQAQSRESADRLIRDAGMRVTPQRLAVLEYLISTDRHPSAEQVGSAVNQRFPTVSRASVYNVLHSLAASGLIREVVGGDAVTRYDARTDPHHHFLCSQCGRIEDIPWERAEVVGPAIGDGRLVESYEVLVRGRCAACVTSGPSSEAVR